MADQVNRAVAQIRVQSRITMTLGDRRVLGAEATRRAIGTSCNLLV